MFKRDICQNACLPPSVCFMSQSTTSLCFWQCLYLLTYMLMAVFQPEICCGRDLEPETVVYGSVRLLASSSPVCIAPSFVNLKGYKVWTLTNMMWLTQGITFLCLSLSKLKCLLAQPLTIRRDWYFWNELESWQRRFSYTSNPKSAISSLFFSSSYFHEGI